MRRAAGSHIRSNRQKLALLQRANLDDKRIAPSLKSRYVKNILDKRAEKQKPFDKNYNVQTSLSLVVDRPPVTRHAPRRRSFPKEESPRSGLKPHDTLGVDDRRQSACSIAERRLEEHRKYSSYGVEAPIPIGISGAEEAQERSPSISYTRQPVRSLSAGWKDSFRRKMNMFRRSSPSSLSSRSTQQFLTASPEITTRSNPEDLKMKKSISFSETTRNALRRSFRHKCQCRNEKGGARGPAGSDCQPPLLLASCLILLPTHFIFSFPPGPFPPTLFWLLITITPKSMETLGRVWNRLSIRRPTLAVPEQTVEEEDDMTPEKTREVFQMFNGTPTRRKSETANHHRSVLNQLQNHPPRNATQSPQRQPRISESSVDMARSALRRNSTETHVFANRVHTHRDINVPACSNEDERVNTRRNSLFVKRGSVTMEPIKKVDLEEVYTVNKQLGTGRFGYIKLAEHKQSKQRIAIKFFPRPQTKQADFVREYNYSFFLSPHQNIIDTYEGMFQSSDDTAFFFVQEFCPRASLREAVEATNQTGIGEANTKKVFAAVLSAIEFMHDENLVHRNLKAENILIFDANDYSKVKVTDFGLTRKVDTTVKYLEYVNNYHAAELCDTVVNEKLVVNKSTDIWALGIIFFYCMKGKFPWQKASIMCKPYWEWEQWLKRKNPALPKKFNPFSEKALKLFKKSLTPRSKDRWSAKDMRKCLAKEKLLKSVKRPDEDYYVMIDTATKPRPSATSSSGEPQEAPAVPEQGKRKSTLQQWISTTLTAMAEISEQVVSARDD